MKEDLQLKAKAHVKLTKIDDNGNVTVEEHDVDLTEEEARQLWLSQVQE